jgi:transcriptional regulator with XRE-family HTH domain
MSTSGQCLACRTPLGEGASEPVCPRCYNTATKPAPSPGTGGEQLKPSVWGWTDHASYQALRSGDLGAILRAYRRINGVSQEKLAAALGYDKTYISMIETGRRAVHDVATRRHIGRILAIPSHLLGVTDPADTEFVAMLAFAESTIRLAELARSAGRAAEAVNELWPLVARLEARAAEGHLEHATLRVLGQAWVSLGVTLGTVLPDERLWVATRWTAKGLTAARHLNSRPEFRAYALRMHGNELRKAGQAARAVTVLEEAVDTATRDSDRGAALALLAQAIGQTGDAALFAQISASYQRLADIHGAEGPLFNAFVWREIQLRGLLETGNHAAAFRLAHDTVTCTAPTPQWQVIERITYADVLGTAGDHAAAEAFLLEAVDLSRRYRLPHQIQRAARIAERAHNFDLAHQAGITLAQLRAEPLLDPSTI